jgi:hypothetical protein
MPVLKSLHCFAVGITTCYLGNHDQWRNQPENLVPLCKFKIISIIHFFILFTVNEHENICIAGLDRWAGATDYDWLN